MNARALALYGGACVAITVAIAAVVFYASSPTTWKDKQCTKRSQAALVACFQQCVGELGGADRVYACQSACEQYTCERWEQRCGEGTSFGAVAYWHACK